jgi:hypothetical protein
MTKPIVIGMFCMSISLFASAQDDKSTVQPLRKDQNVVAPAPPPAPKLTPEQRAQKRTDRLTQNLSLTPEQASQVKAKFLLAESIRQTNSADAQKSRQQLDDDINAILTSEQQVKYKELKEKNKAAVQNYKKTGKVPTDSEIKK